jgi:hypothetical protein
MPVNFTGNLIRYIISEVQDQDGTILRTRLVKLLYLCDVESYRSRCQLLTNFDWVRYLYGPYTFQLSQETKKIGLDLGEEELDFSTGRGIKYEVYDTPSWETWLSDSKRLDVDMVIKRWGGEDINLLLDYIYCYTEPMKNAQFLEHLDFRKLRTGLRRSESASIEIRDQDKTIIRQLIEKEGLISRKPISISKGTIASREKNDEPTSPFISGRIKFADTRTIQSIEGRE